MKTFNSTLMLAFAVMFFASCKKSEDSFQTTTSAKKGKSLALAAVRSLTVTTIAGQPNKSGNTDGPGNQALFERPTNMSIAADGSLYVVDASSGKIRKVGIDNVVSTVNIPKSADGQSLIQPRDIYAGKDGTLTIIQATRYEDHVSHPIWILSPDGKVNTPPMRPDNYWDYGYQAVAFDPYSNFLKVCGGRRVEQHPGTYTPFMENLEMKNGFLGTTKFVPPAEAFPKDQQGASIFTLLFCGYNGVKYLVGQNRFIFKLTPSGEFKRIYEGLNLTSITGLIATKDSKTIYVIDRGKILAITNGQSKFLVGPNYNAPMDGVGAQANVSAIRFALSKDESTIYFTDSNFGTVRKLTLR